MYKTVIKDIYDDLIDDKVDILNKLLNDEYENGWELVSMTTLPYHFDPGYCDYVLVFKKRSN